MANKEDIDDDIDTILRYCGFAAANDRTSIAQDGFESFEDIMSLSEKDVSSLAKGFFRKNGCHWEDRIWLAPNKSPKSHCPLGSRLPQDHQSPYTRWHWSYA
jgi:hypothetical protein